MIFLFWKALKFGCRSEHSSYQTHSCLSASPKDVQVPVCPRCSEPVPTSRNVSPDVTLGAHIDQFCRSEKKKIYTNRCTLRNCEKKELIPVLCTRSRLPGTAANSSRTPAIAPIFRETVKPSCSDNSAKHPFRCGNYRCDHLGNHVGGRGADEGTDAFNAGRGRGLDEGASWQWLFGCRLSVPSTPPN
ncbi:AN1-type zinc finger protein 2B [Culex quinquefasciatus]|uniref:AN1-type zinc finger protein 2B n=1 Tax=Culex quinquefasciatus TaxID=7176 RepID=B0WQE1_CULQU|nr:AN1-type zinc finger protein 2B [Culex quinquefasciatus]|eukprot:XP_001850925.1 AN1-type zinc finger protein 2B [Culex quinquefasciatus]